MSIEKSLWEAANQLRANSGLKSSEYSYPVLGLIFLKYADYKFTISEKELSSKISKRNRKIGKEDYLAKGAMYLNDKARFKYLLQLPEGENIGQKVNDAMLLIEKDNPDLKDILPKIYTKFSNSLLVELLRIMDSIPEDIEGDVFGKIYENFLGEFAMSEGRKGGEFFTPTSIVKLIVEILKPFDGRIYDPACGSGGMFVQSARFVKEHKSNPVQNISIFGQEKEEETLKLNKMNLAVHELAGDVKQGISYYEDLHNSLNKFDYVMANPPFNVSGVDKEKLKDDKRFIFGMPSADNANYLWIQIFYSALNKNGKAGFVMGNSTVDIGGSEREIRKKIIKSDVIDVIISIGTNFFYTVTLPCTLWFFNKKKEKKNKILFINAENIYHAIDRAHKEFLPEQIEFISNIVKLYNDEKLDNANLSEKLILKSFPKKKYEDVPNLCAVANIDDIEKNNWSLNPGSYIKFIKEEQNLSFSTVLKESFYELSELNKKSKNLESENLKNLKQIIKDM